jgi:putative hydrolase of the HAD superfamily
VPGIQAVLFDYGGVLVTSQWEAFADYEQRLGAEPGTLARFFAFEGPGRPGTPAWHLLETGELAWAEFAATAAEAAGREGVDLPDVDDVEAMMPLRAVWPMVHRVRRLKDEGYRLGILTNNVRELGSYWRASIPLDVFDAVVDSCEEGIRKPDPEIYRRAADRLGVPAAACLFLDDSGVNVAAAEEVGMRGLVVGPDVDATIAALDEALVMAEGESEHLFG